MSGAERFSRPERFRVLHVFRHRMFSVFENGKMTPGGQRPRRPCQGQVNALKVLVIIPCYNEEANLDRVIARLKSAAPWAAYIVVNAVPRAGLS